MTKALSSPDDIHTQDAALKNGSELGKMSVT